MRKQDGISTLELALVLPVLLLLLTVAIPLVAAGFEYLALSRASAHGVRYATRVETNARMSSDGYLTRRPTSDEVEDFVRDAASPLALDTVTVDPEPASTLPGDLVTVTATRELSFGPLAGIANGVKQAFFGGGGVLPESTVVTVKATGREE
jgi:hypothetical protein